MKKISNKKRKCTLCAVLRWVAVIIVMALFITLIRMAASNYIPEYSTNIITLTSLWLGMIYWRYFGE